MTGSSVQSRAPAPEKPCVYNAVIALPVHLDYYTKRMSMERMGKSPREMRVSDARASELRWREGFGQKNPAERYQEVQKELMELEEKFGNSVEDTLAPPARVLEDREQSLKASRKMHQRIEELRMEKERLEFAIKKSGGNPGDYTVR